MLLKLKNPQTGHKFHHTEVKMVSSPLQPFPFLCQIQGFFDPTRPPASRSNQAACLSFDWGAFSSIKWTPVFWERDCVMPRELFGVDFRYFFLCFLCKIHNFSFSICPLLGIFRIFVSNNFKGMLSLVAHLLSQDFLQKGAPFLFFFLHALRLYNDFQEFFFLSISSFFELMIPFLHAHSFGFSHHSILILRHFLELPCFPSPAGHFVSSTNNQQPSYNCLIVPSRLRPIGWSAKNRRAVVKRLRVEGSRFW